MSASLDRFSERRPYDGTTRQGREIEAAMAGGVQDEQKPPSCQCGRPIDTDDDEFCRHCQAEIEQARAEHYSGPL